MQRCNERERVYYVRFPVYVARGVVCKGVTREVYYLLLLGFSDQRCHFVSSAELFGSIRALCPLYRSIRITLSVRLPVRLPLITFYTHTPCITHYPFTNPLSIPIQNDDEVLPMKR